MSNEDMVVIVATALFAASEALSLIPSIKANGVFQLIINLLKRLKGAK